MANMLSKLDANSRYSEAYMAQGFPVKTGKQPFQLRQALMPAWWNAEQLQDKATGQLASDPALQRAKSAHMELSTGIARLAKMSETPDPYMTKAAHLKAVHDTASSLAGKAYRTMEDAYNGLVAAHTDVQRQIRGLTPETKHAGEIRAYLRSLTDEKRSEVVAKAVQEKDLDTLGAVTNGPGYLSGFTEEHQEGIRLRYALEARPDLIERRDRLKFTNRFIPDAYKAALDHVNELTDHKAVKEADAKAKAARDAKQYAPAADEVEPLPEAEAKKKPAEDGDSEAA